MIKLTYFLRIISKQYLFLQLFSWTQYFSKRVFEISHIFSYLFQEIFVKQYQLIGISLVSYLRHLLHLLKELSCFFAFEAFAVIFNEYFINDLNILILESSIELLARQRNVCLPNILHHLIFNFSYVVDKLSLIATLFIKIYHQSF